MILFLLVDFLKCAVESVFFSTERFQILKFKKKNVFNQFFHFMSINIDLGKKYLL